MSQAYIVNAAPMVIQHGTQDLSTRQVARVPEAIPQHCPKWFIFAQKGPTTPQLVVGAERQLMYGKRTFDERDIYANHATVFSSLSNAEGNTCMYERVIPTDAGPPANVLLSLDVLPTIVDIYDRNVDGSIKLDALGSPIIIDTAPGYKVKWVATTRATEAEIEDFGLAPVGPGDQVSATGVQSTRYPMFELKASSRGSDGNNSGFRMWAPTYKSSSAMPTKMMAKERAFPYHFKMLHRDDEKTSPKVTETIFGEQHLLTTLKPGVIDPLTEKQLGMREILMDSYQNLNDPRYASMHGDFGSLGIYQDNIATVSSMFHAAEIPFIDSWSDFSDSADDIYLFNILSGVTSQNTPYHSFQFVDDANSIRMSEYSNIYAKSGSDGTMNDQVFADLVIGRMAEYLDPNSELQEVAINVESIIYDSGFPLLAKYELINFIAQRKDTFVVLATHDVNDRILQASEEHSLAIALRTRLQMYPESDYFGTPVMRGMIIGRSAKLRNSLYLKRLPLTAEVLIKASRYMGAGIGRWKGGFNFDGAPGSVVDYMYDISITWVPASVRNRNWDVGLNWVQAYDRRSFFFPALKTVYADDTSVLNSFCTALAIGQLNKVAHAAWREFTGVDHLTNAQFSKRVNDFVIARTQGRFDGRFVIEPDAFFTDLDVQRGFSWTLPIKLYANSMKSCMTTFVQAYRMADYQPAQ
jgi:hypothetical protein